MTEPDEEEKKAYEERLRRRLKILQQKFKEGKIKMADPNFPQKSLKYCRLYAIEILCKGL